MTFAQAQEYLNRFINYEIHIKDATEGSFKLEPIKRLLHFLGNPQEKLKIVHVAGSKGKGSTCAMIATILQKSGYRVGLYTSPHLNDLRERIRFLDQNSSSEGEADIFSDDITEEEFVQSVSVLKPLIEQLEKDTTLPRLTFFEVYTAVALYYFFEKKVDVVVLETGLGGRLDATNVVSSLVCALTPISLEHTQILGDTVEAIAAEKAAIIKDCKQKVVIASQPMAAAEVFKNRCREFSIEPVWVGKDIHCAFEGSNLGEQIFEIKTAQNSYPHLKLSLLGWHQVVNAAVAVGVVEELNGLGFKISPDAIYQGFKEVLWPGRFEIVSQKPLIILDSAHNDASCQVLVDTIKEILSDKKVILILGVSDDKDKRSICRVLDQTADEVIVTKANHPRAGNFDDQLLKEEFSDKKYFKTSNIDEALSLAYRQAKPEDVILIAGSIFLVSEARKKCISLKV